MYSSYTAASFARKHELAARHKVNLQGALTWAFEFEDQPYFAGFRQLASNGIDMPVLNVFRMFSRMQGRRLPAHELAPGVARRHSRARACAASPMWASWRAAANDELAVLVWHYHDDDVPGPDAAVKLDASRDCRAAPRKLTHYRIDATHSNSYAAWQRMGSPIAPDKAAYESLRAAGQLAALGDACGPARGVAVGRALTFPLPRQAVSLLVIRSALTLQCA